MGDTKSQDTDSTTEKITEMLRRSTATTLATVPILEYRDLPSEDVYDSLRRLEISILISTDQLCYLALYKAASRAAYIWARTVESEIKQGEWKKVRAAPLRRFSSPNIELKLRESIGKMRYVPSIETLTSFAESYIDKYRHINPESQDRAIIKDFSLVPPNNVVRDSNTGRVSDSWSELDKTDSFYKLIRRIEHKILPYEPADGPKVDNSELVRLITEMKNSMEKRIRDDLKLESPTTAAAAAIGLPPGTCQYPSGQARVPYAASTDRKRSRLSTRPIIGFEALLTSPADRCQDCDSNPTLVGCLII